MKRLLIVDDEALARTRMRRLLDSCADVEVLAEAENGQAAVQLCEQLNPDIVLLDIKMPGMDGIAAAKQISRQQPPPAVIFCTAYNDYALAGFEAEAVAYLVKPVALEKLREALGRCQRLNRAQLAAMPASADDYDGPGITVSDQRHTRRLLLSEVFLFVADSKYVTAITVHGEELLSQSLKELEASFPEHLLRVHRNTLVNRKRLQAVVQQPGIGWCAQLRGTERQPPISRRHLAAVKSVVAAGR